MELFGAGNNQTLPMVKPGGTVSFLQALEGVAVTAAGTAAGIGLADLAKTAGVTSSYTNPFTAPKSTGIFGKSIFATNPAGGGISSAVVVGGLGLLGLGLILWAALRKG